MYVYMCVCACAHIMADKHNIDKVRIMRHSYLVAKLPKKYKIKPKNLISLTMREAIQSSPFLSALFWAKSHTWWLIELLNIIPYYAYFCWSSEPIEPY